MGMADAVVSILIPAYNAAEFVEEAVGSALTQTYPHLEVVAVNDGSTDPTGTILDAIEDPRLKVVHQANAGQCAAANRAFRESSGELVKFFDADDILAPDYVERQVERLGSDRDRIAMGEWARFYDDPGEASFEALPMYRDASPVDWLAAEWMNARPMMQCALWLIPRNILDQSGLWDERLSLINDFEFFARVLLHSRGILYTPGARLYYRSGLGSSLSGQKSRRAVESALNSLMWGTQHLLEAENSERTRLASANVLQDFVFTFYPDHADLREAAQERVTELGGASIEPDGSPTFQVLRRLMGWKLARRAERFARSHKMNPAAMRRKFTGPSPTRASG